MATFPYGERGRTSDLSLPLSVLGPAQTKLYVWRETMRLNEECYAMWACDHYNTMTVTINLFTSQIYVVKYVAPARVAGAICAAFNSVAVALNKGKCRKPKVFE